MPYQRLFSIRIEALVETAEKLDDIGTDASEVHHAWFEVKQEELSKNIVDRLLEHGLPEIASIANVVKATV